MVTFAEFNSRFSAKFQKRLRKLCDPLFLTFGINSFYHQAITKDGRFLFIGTHADLLDYYFVEKHHHTCNPFITQFSQIKSGLYMLDLIEDREYRSSEGELRDKFGVNYFSRITRKEGDVCHQFGFGSHPSNRKTELLVLNQLGLIQQFIRYFEKEMRPVICDMHLNPVNLKKEPALYKTKLILPQVNLDTTKKQQFLKELGIDVKEEIKLTRRENDCAEGILQGKTAVQIAKELKLSPRTVEHYLELLKDKMSCRTKPELFAKLLARKMSGHHTT